MIAGTDIIFLNGASSSGKTSIALALQMFSDTVFYHFALDKFYAMLPDKVLKRIFISGTDVNEDAIDWSKFWSGYYKAAYAVASEGNKVIVDSVCYGPLMDLCLEIFKSKPVVHVGVKCPISILMQRELNRGDRIIGMAESQYDSVYEGQRYDIEFDTSIATSAECAAKIINWLKSGCTPQAFDMIRSRKGTAHFNTGVLESHKGTSKNLLHPENLIPSSETRKMRASTELSRSPKKPEA